MDYIIYATSYGEILFLRTNYINLKRSSNAKVWCMIYAKILRILMYKKLRIWNNNELHQSNKPILKCDGIFDRIRYTLF